MPIRQGTTATESITLTSAALHTVHVLGGGWKHAIDEIRLLASTAPSPRPQSIASGFRMIWGFGQATAQVLVDETVTLLDTSLTDPKRRPRGAQDAILVRIQHCTDTTRYVRHDTNEIQCPSISMGMPVIPKDSGTVLQHVRVPTNENSSSVLVWSLKVVVCRRQGASSTASKWLDWRLPLFH